MPSIHDKPLIQLNSVSIMRGEKKVLKNFSWETKPGEHWFILGENGCGKTTLIEIISGYLWPQEGSVMVLGERYGSVDVRDLRKRIGYVSPWIFNRMRFNVPLSHVVASGIDASAGYWGKLSPELVRRVKKSLKFFGIENLYDRPFGACSSGQQLRSILARAHFNAPKILVLDEPFAQLDIGARLTMYSYLKKLSLQKNAPQIIMVTHHLEDIQPLFTHGMIMKEGKILIQGLRRRILDRKVLQQAFK